MARKDASKGIEAGKERFEKGMSKVGLNYKTLGGAIMIILGILLVLTNITGMLLTLAGLILIYFGLRVLGYNIKL